MANYCSCVKSNYFHVKDEEAFCDMMSKVVGTEDGIILNKSKDEYGRTVFDFECYGSIVGFFKTEEEEDEYDYDKAYSNFTDALQKFVADGDAIIIAEVGNEKLRYITGFAHIITSKGASWVDLYDSAQRKAAEMLGNPLYETKFD